jgi:thiamine biosynthesis lipoprotein
MDVLPSQKIIAMQRVVLVLLSALSLSCSQQSALQEESYNGYAQGTTFHISYLFEGAAKDRSGLIDSILKSVDRSLSTYDSESLISKLNRGDTISIDVHLMEMLKQSKEVFENSSGYFDPTIAPLVQFWGFGPKANANKDTALVDSILNFTGFEKLNFQNTVFSLPLGMSLDFNAIAQGYTVDVLAKHLEAEGIVNYMVEVGGELRCLGENYQGQKWRIGVDKPVEEIDQQDRFQFILALDSAALATSGNYRKFWVDTLSGMRYSHTINTKTGWPVRNRLLSASVIASQASMADAYATAFMAMGLEKAIKFLDQKQDLEAYLIFSDEEGNWQIHQSPGFAKMLVN